MVNRWKWCKMNLTPCDCSTNNTSIQWMPYFGLLSLWRESEKKYSVYNVNVRFTSAEVALYITYIFRKRDHFKIIIFFILWMMQRSFNPVFSTIFNINAICPTTYSLESHSFIFITRITFRRICLQVVQHNETMAKWFIIVKSTEHLEYE